MSTSYPSPWLPQESSNREVHTVNPSPSAESLLPIGHMVQAVQQLSIARNLQEIMTTVGIASRQLTGADSATFVMREGDQSYYAHEDSRDVFLVGKRFPVSSCISGWVMSNREAVSIPDISKDPRIPMEVYRPGNVTSLAMVPIRTYNPIGTIGNYWSAPHHPTSTQMQLLQALADSTAVVMESVLLQQQLEERVHQRTLELEAAIKELRAEAQLRKQMETRVLHLSLTDELTGLSNRRGFLLRTEQLLKLAHRFYTHGRLFYIDLDGLKCVNDELGHDAGDQLIRMAANVLRESFRDSDVLGRIGGDEFVVFATGSATPFSEIQNRLLRNLDHHNRLPGDLPPLSMSIGAVRCDPHSNQSLEDLIHRADAAMYIEKRRKREQGLTALEG